MVSPTVNDAQMAHFPQILSTDQLMTHSKSDDDQTIERNQAGLESLQRIKQNIGVRNEIQRESKHICTRSASNDIKIQYDGQPIDPEIESNLVSLQLNP